MPQRAWSDKRERQYDHIKESLEERGEEEDTAEEVAARTVNKERARAGEARESSRTSTEDISSGRRGGLLSHRGLAMLSGAEVIQEVSRFSPRTTIAGYVGHDDAVAHLLDAGATTVFTRRVPPSDAAITLAGLLTA